MQHKYTAAPRDSSDIFALTPSLPPYPLSSAHTLPLPGPVGDRASAHTARRPPTAGPLRGSRRAHPRRHQAPRVRAQLLSPPTVSSKSLLPPPRLLPKTADDHTNARWMQSSGVTSPLTEEFTSACQLLYCCRVLRARVASVAHPLHPFCISTWAPAGPDVAQTRWCRKPFKKQMRAFVIDETNHTIQWAIAPSPVQAGYQQRAAFRSARGPRETRLAVPILSGLPRPLPLAPAQRPDERHP